MKKIYTLALAAIATSAFAQTPKFSTLPSSPQKIERFKDVILPSSAIATPSSNTPKTVTLGKAAKAQWVGTTMNDQQTNASVYRHIHVFDDGKVSVIWTTSADGPPYTTRGAGYNHFNGTAWGQISNVRIEPERTGFPEYVFNPTTNEEIVISHIVKAGTGQAGGLIMNRKPGVGPGTWTSTTVLDTTATLPGVLWNRSVVSGDYMVTVASYTDSSAQQPARIYVNGVQAPTVYSRYKFSTNEWLVKNAALPNYNSTRNRLGRADAYSIDSRGNNIAILMGGLTDDLTLWKSGDNGETWTTTIIDSFPIPAFNYDRALDTTYTNDGSVNVKLDANGVAHCFWARARVVDLGDTTDQSLSFYPTQNAIMYWNEAKTYKDFQVIGGAVDEDNNGTLDILPGTWDISGRYGNNSLAFQPSTAIDANGVIYCMFNAPSESDPSTDNKNFRDLYLVYSKDGGATWSGILNMTAFLGLNLEQVHATLASKVDANIHLTFLQKTSIGRYDATNNPAAVGPFEVMYMSLDTVSIFAGTFTGLKNVAKNEVFTIEQNFPNPFKYNTNIPVNFTRSTNANVSIVDLIGKTVYSNTFQNVPSGKSNLNINVGSLPAGVYVYTIEAEGYNVSRKLIVE